MKASETIGNGLAPVGDQREWPGGKFSHERSPDTIAAAEVQALAERSEPRARDLFGEIVLHQQRRASRIAYHYLRDPADADEAVQDAFMKAFAHIGTFKPELSFEAWFTRILINGCLDRQKARGRRERWAVPLRAPWGGDRDIAAPRVLSSVATPEQQLTARERRQRIAQAVVQLPERQRQVFLLSQLEGQSAHEVAVTTGLKESTVRVHLFRAVRRLRKTLRGTL